MNFGQPISVMDNGQNVQRSMLNAHCEMYCPTVKLITDRRLTTND
jgi:hypothetical protein